MKIPLPYLFKALTLLVLYPGLLSAQSWSWVAVNTAPASVNVHSGCTASAFDPAGNAVIAGFFKGTITLGNVSLTSGSGSSDDLFVARFDASGACVQAIAIPANGAVAHIRALAVEPNGTVVIGGETLGLLRFNSTTSVFSSNGVVSFVARLNSAGTWTQAVAGAEGSQINDLALDAQGNAWVTGFFSRNTTYFGALAVYGTSGVNKLFAARLSTVGVWNQAVQANGTGNSQGTAIAVDASGNPVIGGTFAGGPVVLGPTSLANAGGASGNTGTDIVVARLNSAGSWAQAVSAGGPDNDTVNALAVDATGTAVLTGVVQAAGTFGAISPLQLYRSGYVARLSTGGTWQQAAVFPSLGYIPQKLVLSASGTAYTGGQGVVCQMSATGQWALVAGIGTGGNDHTVGGLSQAANGDLLIAGQLGGSASFGNLTVNPDNRFMYFTARMTGLVLSAKAISAGKQLNVFPQPAHDFVNLGGVSGMVSIQDIRGQEVRRFRVTAPNQQVDVSGLSAGIYLIRAGELIQRLIVE